MELSPAESTVPLVKTADKRRFQRFEVDVRLSATFCKSATRVAIQGSGSDLSQSGVAVFLPIELAVGECIDLDLILPYATQPLRLKAVVRNRRSFTYGMEFVHPTAAQRAMLARACTALAFLE